MLFFPSEPLISSYSFWYDLSATRGHYFVTGLTEITNKPFQTH